MRAAHVLFLLTLAVPSANGQSVISAHSGLINYSEGAVFIDNQPLVRRSGRYTSLREGAGLQTHDGRAELLLSPNAWLRVGMDSEIRMVSASLADTQIELLSGSAILDCGNARTIEPLTLIVKEARIRVENPSRLRIDAEPPQIRVEKGEAAVARNGTETKVAAEQRFSLAGSSVVQRMTEGTDDLLDLWSMQRNRLIYLNLVTSQNLSDPGTDSGVMAGSGLPGDLGLWTGLLPPATGLIPNSGLYFPPVSAFGYGYGFYSPYFPSVAVYGFGFGRRYGYRSAPAYRPFPAYPGTVRGFIPSNPAFRTIPTRPVGSMPGAIPRGGGITRPQPSPRVPVHR